MIFFMSRWVKQLKWLRSYKVQCEGYMKVNGVYTNRHVTYNGKFSLV